MTNYKKLYDEWLNNDYFDKETKEELISIRDNTLEIEDRFYKSLEFGTGGLRGIIGAGTNRINIYTVRKATQGLANQLKKKYPDSLECGVVIAYDSRIMSLEFAEEATAVLATNGIKVYLFDELRPTPELSFAVRHLNAIAGIVITASHNPSQYNGYKVYNETGCQILPDEAGKIIAEIEAINDITSIKTIDFEKCISNGLIEYINDEIDNEYLECVNEQLFMDKTKTKEVSIVYTPLHGTGLKLIKKLYEDNAYGNMTIVKEQSEPDGRFPTVKSPNPEERSAFEIALKIAEKNKADIVLGTDPDADRVGAFVLHNDGEYHPLNGNQIGSLLVDYVLREKQERKQLPINPAIVKTIVTSELGALIAKKYGCSVFDTLTGFKYIGDKMNEFDKDKSHNFVIGYEESYGYLAGTYARDKDAVISTLLISEMAEYYKSKGMTLIDALEVIYSNYGEFNEKLESETYEGIKGMEKIQDIMTLFRSYDEEHICGLKILEVNDYMKSVNGLPKSNVLKFILEGDSWIAVRPSGTEPKIKFYYSIKNKEISKISLKKYL